VFLPIWQASATVVDVDVRIIPLAAPSASDTTETLPSSVASVNPGQSHVLEVWASDTGSENTGLVSAYLDISYDTAWVDATGAVHSGLFPVFLPPDPLSIDDGSGLVDEFGGSSLVAQGIAPTWCRLGYISMLAGTPLTPQLVTGSAQVGFGGVGVWGRSPGEVFLEFDSYVVNPEPASLALAGMALWLAACRRRVFR